MYKFSQPNTVFFLPATCLSCQRIKGYISLIKSVESDEKYDNIFIERKKHERKYKKFVFPNLIHFITLYTWIIIR